MITRKNLLVVILSTFCLTAVLFSAVPVNSAGVYDPWVDVKRDGAINVLDLIKVAGSLGTTGDPTLTVNVANWPGPVESTVWYDTFVNNAYIYSYVLSANGNTHVNFMAICVFGAATVCSVSVCGVIWNFDHSGYFATGIHTITLTPGAFGQSLSCELPTQNFYFTAVTNSGSPSSIWLAYTLSWT